MEGRKNDTAKERWDLLPVHEVREVVKVLTLGAGKYSDDNWQRVPAARDRYYAAALRHLTAWREGQRADDESCLHPLAHAICCLLFLMWFDFRGKK